MKLTSTLKLALCLLVAGAVHPEAFGQASPYRGLWVGSASVRNVNEVAVPLDEDNVPIAPDPEVPTPAYDAADLRIILHVNGAGQVSLLRDVAILNRAEATNDTDEVFATDADLVLVTDPRTYASYPPQPAVRIGTAMFDFGDAAATEALDALVERAAADAAAFALEPGLSVATEGQQNQAIVDSADASVTNLEAIVANADVAEAFSQYVMMLDTAALDDMAATNEAVIATNLYFATLLRDRSFYRDERGIDMVNAIVDAVTNAPPAERELAAYNTAASYADVENLYQRFISGKAFGDMVSASADEAAAAALLPGATLGSIDTAMRGAPETISALTNAINAKVPFYDETRSDDAVDTVLEAIASTALANNGLLESDIRDLAYNAGLAALSDMVARYPLPVQTPTIDYNTFVTSDDFIDAAAVAAEAAAEGAIGERADNIFYTSNSVFGQAKLAAVNALQAVYQTAARALRTELPLEGTFAPGSGDTKLIAELAQPSDLGDPGLIGRIYLPANHPTNPFRHRRHPDHTTGFNIERIIRFDFDGMTGDDLEPAGFGVDSITGIYREEIFGLHKPLGPDPDTDPVGLKTEGTFKLDRISLIDTLNAR